MSFAWPFLLWLLLVPAAVLIWELSRRRRRAAAATHPKILRAEIGKDELSLSRAPAQAGPRYARPWLAFGLMLAIVALARPQWGRIDEPVFDQSREILLAVDVSRSMLAPDVKPSRLDRTKLLIQGLLERLEGERVGLVVFSGTAFLQSPLSADYEILREFLPALGPDYIPEGGTNYRALIDTSLDAFGNTGTADRFLIVLSDGEATEDDWKARVDELKKKGVRVIGLGVGTALGTMLPDGSGGFIKDERGAVVLSKLESRTLQQLAESTGGTYRDASVWLDLAQLIDDTVNAGRKGEFTETRTVRLVDRFQWPLALALWCFLVSFYYEFPVKPRPREIALKSRPGSGGGSRPAQAGTVAGWLFLLVFPCSFLPSPRAAAAIAIAPPPPAAASPGNDEANAGPSEQRALSRIVGRVSNSTVRTGRDWAELARETVSWGSRLQSAQRPVPEGPVRDALQAVELGSKLDPRTADWQKLRQELEALLNKPENQQQQQQQQDQQQNKQEQNQNPDQQKQEQKQQQKSEEQQSSDKGAQPPPEQPKPEEQLQKQQEDSQQQSAFGEMKPQEQPPPPPPSETQKVGGAPEKQKDEAPVDPAMAVQMEKLEQLKQKDSPAVLFEKMHGGQSGAKRKKPAKDW